MCSVTSVMMWSPFSRYISATPLMARLSLSVAPEVKTISFGVRADQARDLLAGMLHRLLGLPAKRVIAAGGVAELLREVGQHRLHYARVHRRGGVVVHVDRQLHAVRCVGFRTDGSPPDDFRNRTVDADQFAPLARHVGNGDAGKHFLNSLADLAQRLAYRAATRAAASPRTLTQEVMNSGPSIARTTSKAVMLVAGRASV